MCSLIFDIAGSHWEPSAKKARTNPTPGEKRQPTLPPKVAAGQAFLREQLQEMSNTHARVSAKNTESANARAIYKQECAMYQAECRRQEKHNDRVLDMYRLSSANAERCGLPPPQLGKLDERVLQKPVLPACMRHVDISVEKSVEKCAETEEDSVPNTQNSPAFDDPDAHLGPNDQPFSTRYGLASP